MVDQLESIFQEPRKKVVAVAEEVLIEEAEVEEEEEEEEEEPQEMKFHNLLDKRCLFDDRFIY